MWILGKVVCLLGALALVLLGVDMLSGHAGFEFPGGVLRFLVLLPTAIVGSLIGFLMLRAVARQPATRRLLLLGALIPLLMVLAIFGSSQLGLSEQQHGIVVFALIAVWALYAFIVLRGGLQLRQNSSVVIAPTAIVLVGVALLIQSAGAFVTALTNASATWAGDMSFLGAVAAGVFMIPALMAIVAHRRAGQ